MIVPFERWLENNSIPDESKDLFLESVVCYKVSAYRSSFIMSYIAFQNILKQRILGSQHIPNGIAQQWWNDICGRLRNEDKWDAAVTECVERSTPDRVFVISGSIVSEYEAYRVIRNKCAHGKNGKVDYYHIESFWNFIQENYYKFVVNGGKDGIIQQIKDHYDRTITPIGTDVSPLVERIKLGILDADLPDLISSIYSFFEGEYPSWKNLFKDRNRMIDLWDKLVNQSEDRIHNAIIDFIKREKPDLVCCFVGRYPSTADEFLADTAFSRLLWTGLIDTCEYDNNGFWNLTEKIIRNSLVPEAEKSDFDKLLYKSVGKSFPYEKEELLKLTGYFGELRKYLFTSNDYTYPSGINHANAVSNYFRHYIAKLGLDESSVSCINAIFSFATYGSFFDVICNYMRKEENLQKYREIVAEKGWADYSEKFAAEIA